MRNRFFEHPNESNIKETGSSFCLSDAIIALDTSDVDEIMGGAENAIVLSGKASGSNRCGDAIEDAVLHTCEVARGYDLFSASKLLLFILCPKGSPMMMRELEPIHHFIQMFHPNILCKWGMAEKDQLHDMKIMIIASNLQKK